MTEKPHILIVDDEPAIRLTLEAGLSLKGFRVSSACSGSEAFSFLEKQKFDAVLCDILMPDGDGLKLAQNIRELDNDLPLILMTAQGSVETAVKAIGEGASDFIAKPFEIANVAALMRRHLEARREKRIEPSGNKENLPDKFSKSGLIGRSSAMVSVYKLVAFAARTSATVLISGESGTGKELVARAVHAFSERAAKKFVSVNCSGLTDTLLEAELFGYEKGALPVLRQAAPDFLKRRTAARYFLMNWLRQAPVFKRVFYAFCNRAKSGASARLTRGTSMLESSARATPICKS
jgi:two-component system nitrogen regulation response regulator GlnG